MDDAPARTHRQLIWSLICSLLVAVGSAVISGATGGLVSMITNGVAVLGGSLALSTAGELYRLRHPSKYHDTGRESPVRLYALGVLAIFFAAAGSFIYWAMEEPDSGCLDCDTTEGHLVAVCTLIASWGATGFLVWRMLRLRREQSKSRQDAGR